MNSLPWIILFLPLLAAAGITLFSLKDRLLSARLSISAVVLGFVLSLAVFFYFRNAASPVELTATWLSVGGLQIDFGVRLDPLSLLMLLIVTGVGGAIHIYSYGYMSEDRDFSRYFASLSLFTFAMLGIVLSTNFIQMFIFWELVGLSSYLLIGFWYEKPAAADAGKKAFLTNRLGDFGFLLGIILVWDSLGSLSFGEIENTLAAHPEALGALATLAGLLIFCGAMGKSAQFPLHVWLPDAMEGPTPVSALIHAATMVAAGVYMLCRVFFIFTATQAWPESWTILHGITSLGVISWIGGLTALLAALIALQQNDIKRILAYSTLSQLGYMVMAVGLSAPAAAMFHLTTHACFKALLFLGAGAVILSLHHEQDIWRMGGLQPRMSATYWTFLFATLALCGAPPFSGFFSKDEILAAALAPQTGSVLLFVLGAFVAFLTALYMTRLFLVAFQGSPRTAAAAQAAEAPKVMKWPLILLAIPSVLAGFWGVQTFLGHHFDPGHAGHSVGWTQQIFAPFAHSPLAALMGLMAVALGFSFGFTLYAKAETDPLPRLLNGFAGLMKHRFFFDEVYGFLIRVTHDAIAQFADWFDRWVIAGLLVRGAHGATELAGRALRLVQTGHLHTYTLLFVLGIVILIFFVLQS